MVRRIVQIIIGEFLSPPQDPHLDSQARDICVRVSLDTQGNTVKKVRATLRVQCNSYNSSSNAALLYPF